MPKVGGGYMSFLASMAFELEALLSDLRNNGYCENIISTLIIILFCMKDCIHKRFLVVFKDF